MRRASYRRITIGINLFLYDPTPRFLKKLDTSQQKLTRSVTSVASLESFDHSRSLDIMLGLLGLVASLQSARDELLFGLTISDSLTSVLAFLLIRHCPAQGGAVSFIPS